MWLDGQPSDLQPLMALKGMRKADQQVQTVMYDARKFKFCNVVYGIAFSTV